MIQKLFLSDKRYLANVVASFLSQAVSALSVLFLTPLLLQSLGNEEFAVYGLVLNAIVWGGIMDLGMNMGMLRRLIHEKERTTALFSSLSIFYAALFFLLTIAATILHIVFPSIFGEVKMVAIVATILLMLQNVFATMLDVMIQTSQKIFKAKIIRIIKTITEFLLIYVSLKEPSLEYILFIMVFVNFMYIIFLYLYAKKEIDFHFDTKEFKFSVITDHLHYSLWYFLTTLSVVLVFNSQVFIMDKLSGAAALAQFIVFMRFFEIIRTSVSNFTVVLFPTIVTQEKAQDAKSLLQLLRSAYIRSGILLLLLFVFLYFTGEFIFRWWTKNRVEFDPQLFLLFLVFTTLILIDNVAAIFLSALKLNRLPTIISLVQGLLSLVLTYFSLKEYGLFGVLVSSLAALILTNLIFNPFYLIKKLKWEG
jgi:O-antigen/teichoic acid export membrane protein